MNDPHDWYLEFIHEDLDETTNATIFYCEWCEQEAAEAALIAHTGGCAVGEYLALIAKNVILKVENKKLFGALWDVCEMLAPGLTLGPSSVGSTATRELSDLIVSHEILLSAIVNAFESLSILTLNPPYDPAMSIIMTQLNTVANRAWRVRK